MCVLRGGGGDGWTGRGRVGGVPRCDRAGSPSRVHDVGQWGCWGCCCGEQRLETGPAARAPPKAQAVHSLVGDEGSRFRGCPVVLPGMLCSTLYAADTPAPAPHIGFVAVDKVAGAQQCAGGLAGGGRANGLAILGRPAANAVVLDHCRGRRAHGLSCECGGTTGLALPAECRRLFMARASASRSTLRAGALVQHALHVRQTCAVVAGRLEPDANNPGGVCRQGNPHRLARATGRAGDQAGQRAEGNGSDGAQGLTGARRQGCMCAVLPALLCVVGRLGRGGQYSWQGRRPGAHACSPGSMTGCHHAQQHNRCGRPTKVALACGHPAGGVWAWRDCSAGTRCACAGTFGGKTCRRRRPGVARASRCRREILPLRGIAGAPGPRMPSLR